jgi:GT2 family glycosyltransferase/glycosyltransferase involved in cell wall biosynthesis
MQFLREPQSKIVTIIIPIFNAYEDTQRCVESVLNWTDAAHQVLLIDDASSDQRLGELINFYALQYEHITAYRNAQNLGFVKTCNSAFAFVSQQKHDVVLLNSDTIVTANWLEKLIVAAYSSDMVGTVTPLTNNGTICSVPAWLEANEIPTGQTLESFAELIESKSLRKYPRIPTAVGFCMYIKQEVLNKIGYFDEINFYRGYGEENDFCCRASQQGYFHIIDDATFVYHAGSKSFTSEKKTLIEQNSKILAKVHPRYFQEVEEFIASNPLREILKNIQLNLALDRFKSQSPICFILHNSISEPKNSPLGGTEYHCAALIHNLRDETPIYCIYYNQILETLDIDIYYQSEEFDFSFPCSFSQPYRNKHVNHETVFLKLFVRILSSFKPSLIHIHHLKGLPLPDVITALRQTQIPYIVSLHDYYLICPSYNLLDYKKMFCFEHKTPDYCRTCVQKLMNEGEHLREQWFGLNDILLQGACQVIAPSQTACSYYEREYPLLKQSQKTLIIRHGCLSEEERQARLLLQLSQGKASRTVFQVALVGSTNLSKGSENFSKMLLSVWNRSDLRDAFSFHIFGRFDGFIPFQIKNVSFKGEYSRLQLAERLREVDVAIFPGIWAETYCLAVDDVLAAGIPVLVTPLSAAAERVKEFKVGWVSNSETPEDLLKILIELKGNPNYLATAHQNLQQFPIVSYEEMTRHYRNEYSRILAQITENETTAVDAGTELPNSDILAAAVSSSSASLGLAEASHLRTLVNAMESSKFWKLRLAWFKVKRRLGFPER